MIDQWIPLELLEFESMASGDLSLMLTDLVTWTAFADYAEAVAAILDAEIGARADAANQRVWELTIEGCSYWICFQDFGLGVSLDSQDEKASAAMVSVHARLLRWRLEHPR